MNICGGKEEGADIGWPVQRNSFDTVKTSNLHPSSLTRVLGGWHGTAPGELPLCSFHWKTCNGEKCEYFLEETDPNSMKVENKENKASDDQSFTKKWGHGQSFFFY